MLTLFWISIAAILYAYAGYPLVLWLICRLTGKKDGAVPENADEALPRVTLIISAYNEAAVMEDKIQNSLALDYPRDRFEVVVVSDGSNDGTDEIVRRHSGQGVVLLRFEGRIGKTACLNRVVPAARAAIVVFSDANALYDAQALRRLVRHFQDPRVGFVSGATKYAADARSRVKDTVGLYSRIEYLTKTLESKIGSCVGADGAMFAIRKELYRELRSVDINDLVIPLSIVRRGLRGVFDPAAHCSENTAPDAAGEFRRQARITNRTIRALVLHRELFNPVRYGMFSFQLASHKLAKLTVPFFLILLFVASAALMHSGWLFGAAFSGQAALYLSGWIGSGMRCRSRAARFVAFGETFVKVNAAILQGWMNYFKGETCTAWTTARSQ